MADLPHGALSDPELLARHGAGDPSALDALFERHETPLYCFLLGILRDPHQAEDALQETFVRALERLDGVDPEQETLAKEREGQLREALLGLRQSYREAVILRDVEGFSYEEVADTLQISIGTVKSRISRGRLELRRKLEGSL